ncbi:hypothetical protein MTR67_045702 [Solanum verrucosum]|uniref:Nuclear factor related to kappa-B-binding protein second winged helix domain-containing protein n=1 Tax=Solanum verrucosum TaxID=315347 RepID=A0AAF0UTV1_SOLVR|nr:hypothetical protein MTR67_045702 [Solanum verrucosum]
MTAPLNRQRSQSSTKPHLLDGPYVPTMEVKVGEITRVIPKTRKQYNDSDKQLVQKYHKARKLLICGLSVNEYDLISSCESAKEIWDLLRTTYEGTEEIKKSKLDLFITQFEGFTMKEGEPIHEIRTRFSTIIDELMFLEEPVPVAKQVSKILEILPRSWTNDFVIENETREPDVMTIDATAGLPGGVGTRDDVCVLARDSQFIVENISNSRLSKAVKGGLDRLHCEDDPCVKYEMGRHRWTYLHGDRKVEDFEDDST